jgi:hypothetical protein
MVPHHLENRESIFPDTPDLEAAVLGMCGHNGFPDRNDLPQDVFPIQALLMEALPDWLSRAHRHYALRLFVVAAPVMLVVKNLGFTNVYVTFVTVEMRVAPSLPTSPKIVAPKLPPKFGRAADFEQPLQWREMYVAQNFRLHVAIVAQHYSSQFVPQRVDNVAENGILVGRSEGKMAFRIEGNKWVEVEQKKSWMAGDNPKVLAGVLTCAAALLNFFGRWPKAMWAIAVVAGVLLFWLIGSGIRALVRRLTGKRANRVVVATKYPELVQLFERLKQFTNRENTRGFRYMLYNASAYRVDMVDQILGCDFIEGWMACFETMLHEGCPSVTEFLARCGHFTPLVREFNDNYVIKAQKAFARSVAVPEHNLDDFEEFRERFAIYLNDVEQWAESIVRQIEPRVPIEIFLRYAPQRSFERAKSFKKQAAMTAGSVTTTP